MVGDIKHIFVIESLFLDDIKTGRELYEDVIKRQIDRLQHGEEKIKHHFYDCNSKINLLDYLAYIAANANLMRNGILIHLEVHGREDKNGLVLSDQSSIKWDELISGFRQINIASSNNLYLSLASCYGRFLFEGINPEMKSPYSGYISASKEVLPDEIIENFSEVFISLIEQGNLIKAFLSVNSVHNKFFYKDSKTTFDLLTKLTFDRMMHDPLFKEEIFEGPMFKDALTSGIASNKDFDQWMYTAFREISLRHRMAFEFNDND